MNAISNKRPRTWSSDEITCYHVFPRLLSWTKAMKSTRMNSRCVNFLISKCKRLFLLQFINRRFIHQHQVDPGPPGDIKIKILPEWEGLLLFTEKRTWVSLSLLLIINNCHESWHASHGMAFFNDSSVSNIEGWFDMIGNTQPSS